MNAFIFTIVLLNSQCNVVDTYHTDTVIIYSEQNILQIELPAVDPLVRSLDGIATIDIRTEKGYVQHLQRTDNKWIEVQTSSCQQRI